MGAAKKFELAPDEVFIQETLKSGRAKLDENLSMKAIGKPDVAFQARVKHLDMDHVHRLSAIHDQDGKLAPIVVFMAIAGATVRYILADGFHRHEVYRRKGLPAIRAYVVECSMEEIEHEARLYAAICNRVVSLPRTKDDIRKAVEMLFVDPVCWRWPSTRIASHCGVTAGTAMRYKKEYALRTGIDFPEEIQDKTGRPRKPTSPRLIEPEIRESTSKKRGFYTCFSGKTLRGSSPQAVKAKLVQAKALVAAKSVSCDNNNVRAYLLNAGVLAEFLHVNLGRGQHIVGLGFPSAIVVGWVPEEGSGGIRRAMGDILLLSAHVGNTCSRRILVGYRDDMPGELVRLGRLGGIEFLSPEELVSSLKGQPGAQGESS